MLYTGVSHPPASFSMAMVASHLLLGGFHLLGPEIYTARRYELRVRMGTKSALICTPSKMSSTMD